MFNWIKNYKEYSAKQKKKKSEEPYIEIVSEGIDPMGRLRIEFDWNSAFIVDLRKNGFEGASEEDIVQKWFQAITTSHLDILIDEDNALAAKAKINPAEHPDLS